MSGTGRDARFRPGSVEVITVVSEDQSDYVTTVEVDDRGALGQPVGARLYRLPHQCDSWVIGTADDVRALIAELSQAIKDE